MDKSGDIKWGRFRGLAFTAAFLITFLGGNESQARKFSNWDHVELTPLYFPGDDPIQNACSDAGVCSGCGPNGTQDSSAFNAEQAARCADLNGGVPVYSEYNCGANNPCAASNQCSFTYTCYVD